MKQNYLSIMNSEKLDSILKIFSTRRIPRFNRKEAALLILDMQHYFLSTKSHAFVPDGEYVIQKIQKLVNFFEGRPIVATQHVNTPENAHMMNTWWKEIISEGFQSDICSEFSLLKTLKKTQYDAFYETNLENMLSGVKQLVITGVMTHLCCDTTARSAFMRGFEVFIPYDGVASYNQSLHDSSLLCLSHGCAHIVKVSDIYEQ